MTDTTAELEARLAEARAAEQRTADDAGRLARERDLAYRRQRLAAFDPAALRAETQRAEATLSAALSESPVFAAFAHVQVARWREHRCRQLAHDDRAALAPAEGAEPPHDPGTTPPPLSTDDLLAAVSRMVTEAVMDWTAEIDASHTAAVYGDTGLDPEHAVRVEAEAEAERRRQAALSVASGSTDVTGMTEAERAERGLPPGRSREHRSEPPTTIDAAGTRP